MKWSDTVLKNIKKELSKDKDWLQVYKQLKSPYPTMRVHLAIFNEPFLTLVFEGKKTIESRFSLNKINPHGKICKGDIVITKKSGGAVIGFFQVGEVIFSDELTKHIFNKLKTKYSEGICANIDSNFWDDRKKSKYATLVTIAGIKKLKPFFIEKRDRRGWVILNSDNSSD